MARISKEDNPMNFFVSSAVKGQPFIIQRGSWIKKYWRWMINPYWSRALSMAPCWGSGRLREQACSGTPAALFGRVTQAAMVLLPAVGAEIAFLNILHEALFFRGATTSFFGFA